MTDLNEKTIQEFIDDPDREEADLVCPQKSLPGIVLVLTKETDVWSIISRSAAAGRAS